MAEPAKVPRDHWNRPLVIPPREAHCVPLMRASNLAQTLEDAYALGEWQQQMVLLGVQENPWLLDKVAHVPVVEGKRDWKQMQQLCAIARDKAGAKDAADYGTMIHGLSERLDRGEPLDIAGLPEHIRHDLMAYDFITMEFEHRAIEEFMVCWEVMAAGTPDRRSVISLLGPDDRPLDSEVIVDLKTGREKPMAWRMQLAIYAHSQPYKCLHPVSGKPSAQQCEANASDHDHGNVEIDQRWGVVVRIPAETGEFERYWVDLITGWGEVQLAAEVRESRKAKGTLLKFAA